MSSRTSHDLAGVDDPVAARRWLDSLLGEPAERLPALVALCERTAQALSGPDISFEILELLRPELVADSDRLLERVHGASIPFAREVAGEFGQASAALESLHRAYRSVYARMIESDSLDTRSIIPGATNAIRVVMPLARGLDALSRRLVATIRCRVVVDAADWQELAMLAQHVRATTFLDESLRDPIGLYRPVSARCAITYPLLLAAARIDSHSGAASRLVERLARRWASKVGFRFDQCRLRADHSQGPLLALTPILSARLDTHRLVRSLGQRREEWLSQSHAPGRGLLGLEHRELSELLDRLAHLWGAQESVCGPMSEQVCALRLRIGLPDHHASGQAGRAFEGTDPQAAYSYGKWEQNTIIRLSFGAQTRGPDALAGLAGGAENARRLGGAGDDRAHWFVERRAMTPAARRTDLVALFTDTEPAMRAAGLRLARIESLRQLSIAGSAGGWTHRLELALMPGRAIPVGVRAVDEDDFCDGFALCSAGSAPDSIVVAPGSLGPGTTVLVRIDEDMLRARVGECMLRGRHFEQLALALEPSA